ncbi:hypothetical protein KC909_05240 [Candidatus Dojkabacteria bacterium]|uniref:Uncharacterized protein n=1 Tax=Candidatus Dojkabacteria bacterium TaxID=2099670 RepID=A0A955L6Q8_9BACT|nr:hypothetical protein [Candidatus Dojkabacteria bacterium]
MGLEGGTQYDELDPSNARALFEQFNLALIFGNNLAAFGALDELSRLAVVEAKRNFDNAPYLVHGDFADSDEFTAAVIDFRSRAIQTMRALLGDSFGISEA